MISWVIKTIIYSNKDLYLGDQFLFYYELYTERELELVKKKTQHT